MDKKPEDKSIHDANLLNEIEPKVTNKKSETSSDYIHLNASSDKYSAEKKAKKDEEEEDEEEEEEEEDRIIEKSPNLRFHKRNKKFMRKVPGIDNSFIAIEPKSGKEVIWNEVHLTEKRTDQENRFINIIKKLKRYNHPFFVRYLDVWQPKTDGALRKIVFVTEQLTDPTMKQYFVNSSSSQRLTNKSLWRKFVGQLLSVLKFLKHLGVNHGNLSNETVYYQNTGCLKVGTLAVDLNFENKSANDIYDVGILALEMDAYEALDDAGHLGCKDRIQKMLSRVADLAQYSFIHTCVNIADTPTSLAKLFQHVVLIEVPSLKRVAAKIIVQHNVSTTEDGKDEKCETQHSVFANLIKEQTNHFEDETVLFKVVFEHENITKIRLWKEFRVNFANLPKYLEDVRNGFYPIFEAKSDQSTEEVEDVTYSYSVDQEISRDGILVVNGLVNTISRESNMSQMIETFETIKELIPADQLCKDNLVECTDDADSNMKNDSTVTVQPQIESKNFTRNGIDKVCTPSQTKESAVNVESKNENPSPETLKIHSDENKIVEIVLEPVIITPPEPTVDSTTPYEDNNDIEEDEEDDEDEDFNNGGNERVEPFWDYVLPPEKPPSDRALFTGCVYSYIGCGRWQIYVQIWFLEDRLKREIIIQVMEHDWSNDERIAAMFENGKIISSVDKPVLERILRYARYNCPLVEGELIPPQRMLSAFDAYDLYQRLEHLQMFDKARLLLEKAEFEYLQQRGTSQSPNVLSSDSSFAHHLSQGISPANTPGEKLLPQQSTDDTVTKTPKASPLTEPISVDDKASILRNFKIGDLPGFKMELMDIRILAPLNFSCMFCDYHDYLHNEDLPPYISSPCYHCREGLAKESKISPATLFDLHQQNLVPWPAFLQVRFNLPPVADGNMSVKELVDYDCKWRGRSPCTCFVDTVLPPCVEFPDMYCDNTTAHVPYTVSDHLNDHKSSVVTDIPMAINVTPGTHTDCDTFIRNVKTNVVFPCSNRHLKGATITCVHGITFPRVVFPNAIQNFYKKIIK